MSNVGLSAVGALISFLFIIPKSKCVTLLMLFNYCDRFIMWQTNRNIEAWIDCVRKGCGLCVSLGNLNLAMLKE